MVSLNCVSILFATCFNRLLSGRFGLSGSWGSLSVGFWSWDVVWEVCLGFGGSGVFHVSRYRRLFLYPCGEVYE